MDGDRALYRRFGAALVILVTAVPLGTQPARSGDAVQAVPPSAVASRVRPLDLVKSSVSRVLAAVQSPTAAGIDYRLIDRGDR